MKKLFGLFVKDLQDEDFTAKEIVWYGICYPVGLLLILGLIEGIAR